jgi:hypothetical protein
MVRQVFDFELIISIVLVFEVFKHPVKFCQSLWSIDELFLHVLYRYPRFRLLLLSYDFIQMVSSLNRKPFQPFLSFRVQLTNVKRCLGFDAHQLACTIFT